MIEWLKSLDRILRGDATRPEAIRDGRIDMPLGGLVLVIILLAMLYGACMGSYALFKDIDPNIGPASDRYLQVLASTLKIPALFFLTLLVTFPSLYVFNALIGSRLTIISVLHLLIASLGVNLAVLASLGPIVAFFSVSTTSYAFMKSVSDYQTAVLFNAWMFAIASLSGQWLLRIYYRPLIAKNSKHRWMMWAWMFVFALVGIQMGWVMRPFIGSPGAPAEFLRSGDWSNAYVVVGRLMWDVVTK